MKLRTGIMTLAAGGALALAPLALAATAAGPASFGDQIQDRLHDGSCLYDPTCTGDQDQLRDQDRIYDQDRDRDRIHLTTPTSTTAAVPATPVRATTQVQVRERAQVRVASGAQASTLAGTPQTTSGNGDTDRDRLHDGSCDGTGPNATSGTAGTPSPAGTGAQTRSGR